MEQLILGKQFTDPVTGDWVGFLPSMMNRHGLIAGATGTGKTLTMKRLAEQLSLQGVPVLLMDVKGDLSGMAMPGVENPKLTERLGRLSMIDPAFCGFPVVFWDVYGKTGHPVRTTISELGPLLLSRLLDLNPTQQSVLTIAFQIADDQGLLLLDINDLQALLKHIDQNRASLSENYGALPAASINAIERELMSFESQGADLIFGEPALALEDLIHVTPEGVGQVNIMAADKLMLQPKLYATLMLWLISELYENLPEVGDVEKPKLVLFLDEAHLLFDDMPDVLMDKLKQVILLIRSKGVGVFFVTQNPMDIGDDVRGQLSHRVIHALRAFSPKEQKSIRALADGFPINEKLGKVETILTQLAVGEALISGLDPQGLPTVTQQTLIAPPQSLIGPLDAAQRDACIKRSPIFGRYDTPVDRESAAELLTKRTQAKPIPAPEPEKRPVSSGAGRRSQDPIQAMLTSAMRAIGSQVGRQIVRGIMGSLR